MHRGIRYRMPVNSYAFARGASVPVTQKQEAEKRWLPSFLGEIYAGGDPRRPSEKLPDKKVSSLIADYRSRHCDAQQLNMDSRGSQLERLSRRFGDLDVTILESPGPIEDFKKELMADELKNATVNRNLALLRHLTNWAIGRGVIRKSPFYNKLTNPAGVRLLKGENERTRRLAEGEEERLLTAAEQLWQSNHADHEYVARAMRARIEIALDFGLRRGEMLKLKNRDIDWRAKPDPILTIQWGNAKSRRTRKIAVVSPRVLAWLDSRRAVGGLDGHPYGDELGGATTTFKGAWGAILELAGITVPSKGINGDLRWHDLRHECGSRLAERNVDIRKVQELLGHSVITVTQRYFNTSTQAVGEAQRKAMGWAKPA